MVTKLSEFITSTVVAITGGTINGTSIGATTPSTVNGTTGTFSNDLTIADKIVHFGDTDTAIRFSANDTISLETSGVQRMRIGSAGGITFPIDTGDRTIEIGSGRSGNGAAVIDLIGDTTYTDYGFRFSREAGGANAPSRFNHRGTGAFEIITQEAADVRVYTNNTERMRITSNGNVGIGATPSAWLGGTAVQIGITGALAGYFSNDVEMSSNSYWNNNYIYLYTGLPASLYAQNSSGQHQWFTASSGTAGGVISFQERMSIGSNGQIGIGASNYGTSGQTIVSAGSGAAPAWGILPVAGGGTGVTTAPAEAARLLGYTSTATAAGTTALTNTSSQYQLFTGSTTQTITLPVTSTLNEGWSFHIVNNSTGNLTVNSSGGNLVTTIISGLSAMVTCIGTTLTTAADWEPGFTDFSALTGTGAVVLGTAPTITNAVISQSNAIRANGTLALAFATNQFVQVTPTAAGAFTTTVPVAGTLCTLIVLTSGTTSFSMTFGTGFRSTAALATGTVTAQRFVLQFVSDGTSLIPTIRTAAIA